MTDKLDKFLDQQSDKPPPVGSTDAAPNAEQTRDEATNLGRADLARGEPSDNTLRNRSFEKFSLPVTVVSQSAGRGLSWRSVLQMIDNWHSSYASIQKMLDHLRLYKTGSLESARLHCERLARFCKSCRILPDDLVRLPREQIELLVRRHTDSILERCKSRGPSPAYANTVLSCLKTFFACNGFNRQNGTELRQRNYHQPPRTTNRPEYIPTLEEALLMAERARNKRNRAVILTLITSGLRNSALRAVQIGDILSELREGKKVLLVTVKSNWNSRIPGACKNSVPYSTFIARTATEAIENMLRERQASFGSYSFEEPLFISTYNQIKRVQRRTKNLTREQLRIIVKESARAADIADWKHVCVHTMRKVFEAVLRSRLSDGTQMDYKDQEFLIGHTLPGSQEHYYDRTKIERLREIYSKLVFDPRPSENELSLEITRRTAQLLGIDYCRIKTIKEGELGRPLSNQEEEQMLEQEIKMAREGKGREEQEIVNIDDLEKYLRSGWTFLSALPNGKAVISRARLMGFANPAANESVK